MPTQHQLFAFIRLSRLHFLAMPVLCYTLGVTTALNERGSLKQNLLVPGLIIELLAQLSVAYLNDYGDMPTDRINSRRTLLSGGSGELTTGVLAPQVALVAAALCQGGALLLAALVKIPALSWLCLLLALGAAIFYTAPPLRLSWHGLGELTTALVAALLVPLWAYSLQTGHLSWSMVKLCLPLLPFIMSMFVAIAAPDIEADRQVGKRTLPVRVGEHRLVWLYSALIALGYAAALLFWNGVFSTVVLLLILPLTIWAGLGLRAPLSLRPWPLMGMIVRAALVPALLLIVLNLVLRFA
ncbi:MAG TPA: prenyltransferase [Aggregatilineaceae bacterium]|nr:prenyltransferase [Aggregatilineaceae bacterium]